MSRLLLLYFILITLLATLSVAGYYYHIELKAKRDFRRRQEDYKKRI